MSMFPQQSTRRPVELEYGTTDRSMFNFFNAVYAWMAVGLALTAAVAWVGSGSQAVLSLVYGGGRGMFAVFALGMFAISIAAQKVALNRSAGLGTVLFLVYCAMMGLLLSAIFIVYPVQTIVAAFLMTGGLFGAMSVYGFVTKRDLTTMGSYLIMGALGLFAASLVNLFLASNALSWFITYAVLAVFIGITAYETQRLRNWAIQFEGNREMLTRIAIVGSLMLYISFINMFLSILRILGSRK
jgi:FtsH-binding integral membrane protein